MPGVGQASAAHLPPCSASASPASIQSLCSAALASSRLHSAPLQAWDISPIFLPRFPRPSSSLSSRGPIILTPPNHYDHWHPGLQLLCAEGLKCAMHCLYVILLIHLLNKPVMITPFQSTDRKPKPREAKKLSQEHRASTWQRQDWPLGGLTPVGPRWTPCGTGHSADLRQVPSSLRTQPCPCFSGPTLHVAHSGAQEAAWYRRSEFQISEQEGQ